LTFVLSGGLAATGLTERHGRLVGRVAGETEWTTIAEIMPAVAGWTA
jgi:hypothetical protein